MASLCFPSAVARKKKEKKKSISWIPRGTDPRADRPIMMNVSGCVYRLSVDGFTNKTKGEMVTFEQSVVVVTMLKIQISSLAASANHSRTDFSSQNH